jgi:hypothetical protein
VREVLNDAYKATVNSGITEDVRKVVDTVGALKGEGVLAVTYDAVASRLNWYLAKAYRKAKIALSHGWLVNQQTKPRQPADLVTGDPMPADRGLPDPDKVKEIVYEAPDISPQEQCNRVIARTGAPSECNRTEIENVNAAPADDNAVDDDNTDYIDRLQPKPAPEVPITRLHANRRDKSGDILACLHCAGEGCQWCVGEEV